LRSPRRTQRCPDARRAHRGPAILAQPTCDSFDIFRRSGHELPRDLEIGDCIDLLSAGAYRASYASVELNGIAPICTYRT
jgi:ornithine decarboxylase